MSKEVMQQALEALEYHREQTRAIPQSDAAIAALKEAIKHPTELDEAIAAGDGTLHGAIDYWQKRALKAEAIKQEQPAVHLSDIYEQMCARKEAIKQAGEIEDSLEAAYAAGQVNGELAAFEQAGEPVAWYDREHKDFSNVERIGWEPLCLCAAPSIQELWTPREIELFDGMLEVQKHHAARCYSIQNVTMGEKQKGCDMERIALLEKCKAMLAAPSE